METKETKFGWDSYFKPTPQLFRRIGDSLLVACTLASTYTVLQDYKVVTLVILFLGIVGKFMTNFFSETE